MHVHVLCRHLDLVLAEREQAPQSDIRIRDVVLPGGELLQVVSLLQDRAVVRGDIQAMQKIASGCVCKLRLSERPYKSATT